MWNKDVFVSLRCGDRDACCGDVVPHSPRVSQHTSSTGFKDYLNGIWLFQGQVSSVSLCRWGRFSPVDDNETSQREEREEERHIHLTPPDKLSSTASVDLFKVVADSVEVKGQRKANTDWCGFMLYDTNTDVCSLKLLTADVSCQQLILQLLAQTKLTCFQAKQKKIQ